MKKFFLSIVLVSICSIVAFSFMNNENNEDVFIGKKSGEENVITAKNEILKACFDQFDIFEKCNPKDFEIILFEFEDGESQYFLYANGVNADEKPLKMRISLSLNGDNFLLTPSGATGESCTGNPCSHCKFKKKGGCECTTWGGVCNHSVSKN